MAANVAQKLIQSHLLGGETRPGAEIALKVEQILLQDVLGILVMLELEAMGVERSKAEVAVQYVDHNLVQGDHLNAEEHLFLLSCTRFLWTRICPTGDRHGEVQDERQRTQGCG